MNDNKFITSVYKEGHQEYINMSLVCTFYLFCEYCTNTICFNLINGKTIIWEYETEKKAKDEYSRIINLLQGENMETMKIIMQIYNEDYYINHQEEIEKSLKEKRDQEFWLKASEISLSQTWDNYTEEDAWKDL